jgi:hypothetical protein
LRILSLSGRTCSCSRCRFRPNVGPSTSMGQ